MEDRIYSQSKLAPVFEVQIDFYFHPFYFFVIKDETKKEPFAFRRALASSTILRMESRLKELTTQVFIANNVIFR